MVGLKIEEAESKTNMHQEKARKEAASAAHAAVAAAELSASFTAVHTSEHLAAFVSHRIDDILTFGLFSNATGDGARRVRRM